tara:strand:+ start:256 stop:492 length:237 start_codon:yes stop_codon:yes gene_type:complete
MPLIVSKIRCEVEKEDKFLRTKKNYYLNIRIKFIEILEIRKYLQVLLTKAQNRQKIYTKLMLFLLLLKIMLKKAFYNF